MLSMCGKFIEFEANMGAFSVDNPDAAKAIDESSLVCSLDIV